ncbi:hypothetical protein LguiA_026247 [Lonicera macranthoides]
MSKAAKREANAVSRLAKSKPSFKNHDPDEFQWQTLMANQKKRQEEEKAIKNNELGATVHIDATAAFNQSTDDNEDNMMTTRDHNMLLFRQFGPTFSQFYSNGKLFNASHSLLYLLQLQLVL